MMFHCNWRCSGQFCDYGHMLILSLNNDMWDNSLNNECGTGSKTIGCYDPSKDNSK